MEPAVNGRGGTYFSALTLALDDSVIFAQERMFTAVTGGAQACQRDLLQGWPVKIGFPFARCGRCR